MRTLVVIPARSGSKGLKGKNIKPLNGKPLLFYSIESAREIFPDEDIFISTDSKDYSDLVSNKIGVEIPLLRPIELSSDKASTQDVLIHALEYYEKKGMYYDSVMLLQPTSPFRTKEHLTQAIELFRQNKECDLLVSVKKTDANPYYVLFEEENGYLVKSKKSKATRRQDLPNVYEVNGSIYIFNSHSLRTKKATEFDKIIKFEMSKHYSIDIDDQLDFDFAEYLIKNQNYYL